MTAAAARERLAEILRRARGCEADKVGCSFCYWPPDEMTAVHDETGCVWIANAILSAFPEIGASAPGKDVVEGARRCHAEMAKCDSYDESLHVLAAFATAHAARVRESIVAELQTLKWAGADAGWDKAIAAVIEAIRAGGGR